jgi:hypothetical protein
MPEHASVYPSLFVGRAIGFRGATPVPTMPRDDTVDKVCDAQE